MADLKELLQKIRKTNPSKLSHEQLNLTISRAVVERIITPEEGRMLLRVTALSRTQLWNVMVPLARTCSVKASDTVARVIELCLQSGHSRLPVYEDNPENIIGILHTKELLRFWKKSPRNLRAVEMIRLPTFLPKTLKLSQALSEFRRKKISIAVVIDEYGVPAGLVTSEDLIEQIVGEMQDELAQDHEYIRQMEGRSFMVDTRMPLGEFTKAFGIKTSSKAHSVAGFLLEELQRIPQDGETFKMGGLEVTVFQSSPTGISRIKVNQKKG